MKSLYIMYAIALQSNIQLKFEQDKYFPLKLCLICCACKVDITNNYNTNSVSLLSNQSKVSCLYISLLG